ncbi:MAG: hypothetical protein WBK55_08160 [Alphaproteobacteria bacterium]
MSRKSPLFDPDRQVEDLFIRALTPMAKLLYFLFMLLANKGQDGYLRHGAATAGLAQAADLVGWSGDLQAAFAEMKAAGLIGEDETGIFMPEIREAARLRAKRSAAGKAGGDATTAQRTDVGENVVAFCSSKRRSTGKKPAKPAPQRVLEAKTAAPPRAKEKRTKKENNKYIYIFSKKVFMGDAGTSSENKSWMTFENFTVYRREYEALQLEFPGFSEEKLDALLARHDRYLDENPDAAPAVNENWRAPLLSFLRRVHDGNSKFSRAA